MTLWTPLLLLLLAVFLYQRWWYRRHAVGRPVITSASGGPLPRRHHITAHHATTTTSPPALLAEQNQQHDKAVTPQHPSEEQQQQKRQRQQRRVQDRQCRRILTTRASAAAATTSFDVIVVGSGPSSLVAAACLAKTGKRVCVLEQNVSAGGGLHEWNTQPSFETGLHYVGLDQSMVDTLDHLTTATRDDGDATDAGIEWCVTPAAMPYDSILVGGGDGGGGGNTTQQHRLDLLPVADWLEFYTQLTEKVCNGNADRDALWRYVQALQRTSTNSQVELFFRLKVLRVPGWLRSLLQRLLCRTFLRRDAERTVHQVLVDECGIAADSLTYAQLCGQFGNCGSLPDRLSWFSHCGVVRHYMRGSMYPRHGSMEIVRQLTNTIVNAGGVVWCGAEAERLITCFGSVCGVVARRRVPTKQTATSKSRDTTTFTAPIVIVGTGLYALQSILAASATPQQQHQLKIPPGIAPSMSFLSFFLSNARHRRNAADDGDDETIQAADDGGGGVLRVSPTNAWVHASPNMRRDYDATMQTLARIIDSCISTTTAADDQQQQQQQQQQQLQLTKELHRTMLLFVSSSSAKRGISPLSRQESSTTILTPAPTWADMMRLCNNDVAYRDTNPAYQQFRTWMELAIKTHPYVRDNLLPPAAAAAAAAEVATSVSAPETVMKSATSLTMSRFLGSHEGAAYGIEWSTQHWQSQLLAPDLGGAIAIKGLYITGQHLIMVGLSSAVSAGILTANAVCGYGHPLDLLVSPTPSDELMPMVAVAE